MSNNLFKVEEKVIDIGEYRITVKELSAFDYVSARKILKEDRDDEVAIDLALAAISMKKIEKLVKPATDTSEAVYETIELPPVKDASDLMMRTQMPLHLWKKFTEKSAEFNQLLSPDGLEK